MSLRAMRTFPLAVLLALSSLAFAQDEHQHPDSSEHDMPTMQHDMGDMPGMKMPGMDMDGSQSFLDEILHHATSGTSAEPNSTPAPMLMTQRDGWMLMLHGEAFLNEQQQSGPRGGDKFFSTNWIMPMAQRKFGAGTLTIRGMFSLEPATITNRRYPELFQLGETAYGRPIVDGQHPHDFFMEVAALYDLRVGKNGLVSFYYAPVGDPALGPTAYPHRASASEDPLATLGHHLEDSTHIGDQVITGGVTYKKARVEVSGFHGREPDEYRWNIDLGAIDSWSTRLTVNPANNWSAQYSIGRLHSPEALHADEDVVRMTASIMYNRPLQHGNWASTLLWGRNHTTGTHSFNYNGYLAESTLRFQDRNWVWGRVENVDRTSELALGEAPEPSGFEESFLARVQAYSAGYAREIGHIQHLSTSVGAQLTYYSKPSFLDSIYGSHPVGVVMFVRFRLGDEK